MYAVLGVIFALFVCEGQLASAAGAELEKTSLVFGKFQGQTISKQGEISLFNWKSAEWKIDYLQVYNIDSTERKGLRVNSEGFFTLELKFGNYQIRKKNSKHQAQRWGQKYKVISEFRVPEQSLVNLGTYKILTGKAKLKKYKLRTSYQIQHREDHEAYEKTVVWLKENMPDLLERYGGMIECPFPHGPGKELYSLAEDPDQVIRDMFGFVPGGNTKNLLMALIQRTEKGKFSVMVSSEDPDESLYVDPRPLADFCNGINCAKTVYLTGNKIVKGIQIDVEKMDMQSSETLLSVYNSLARKFSKFLGESHDQRAVEMNSNILRGIIQGENYYRTVWGFDDYTVALGLGGNDRKKEDRDKIFLSVFYEPAMIQ